jgi:uncharacterized protein
MHVLVDGFNLLRGIQHWGPVDSVGQLRLCQMLSRWAQVKKKEVTIIFDGPTPPSGYAEQLQQTGIDVRHSGVKHSADDVIIAEIKCCSNPRQLTVVSSDRQIRAAARRRRCEDIKAEDFFGQLWETLQRAEAREETLAEPEEKRKGLSEEETRWWLREFRLTDEDDDRIEGMSE